MILECSEGKIQEVLGESLGDSQSYVCAGQAYRENTVPEFSVAAFTYLF